MSTEFCASGFATRKISFFRLSKTFCLFRPFIMQHFSRLKNGPFLPLLFVTSFLNFLVCTSVESYARLWQKYAFNVFRMIRRPHVPPTGTRYLYSSSSLCCCRCSLHQVSRWYCTKKRLTWLESSHGHHPPTRAASVRAARGRCFDAKRAVTAPGCRGCSASLEHRVGSLVGQDQTQSGSQQQQYEELVDNS